MVEDIKQACTWHVSSEVLKMSVKTGDSGSAQCIKGDGGTESCPATLQWCQVCFVFRINSRTHPVCWAGHLGSGWGSS